MSYNLGMPGKEFEPRSICSNCESKSICLKAFAFNPTWLHVLILCCVPLSVPYLCTYDIPVHLCYTPASTSYPTPMLYLSASTPYLCTCALPISVYILHLYHNPVSMPCLCVYAIPCICAAYLYLCHTLHLCYTSAPMPHLSLCHILYLFCICIHAIPWIYATFKANPKLIDVPRLQLELNWKTWPSAQRGRYFYLIWQKYLWEYNGICLKAVRPIALYEWTGRKWSSF